jgi:hypothetical protein
VDRTAADIETDLVDLSDVSFPNLRDYGDVLLQPSVDRVRRQIEGPRTNLGGNGPPGRTD